MNRKYLLISLCICSILPFSHSLCDWNEDNENSQIRFFCNTTTTFDYVFELKRVAEALTRLTTIRLEFADVDFTKTESFTIPDELYQKFGRINLNFVNCFNGNTNATLFQEIRSIYSLEITGNKLGSLSFLKPLTSLPELRLSNNEIKQIKSEDFLFNSLSVLDLSKNNLTDISFLKDLANPRTLIHLNLSQNAIGNIDEHLFDNFTNLMILDLSVNKITSVDGASFSGPQNSIQELYINNNQIDIFDNLLKHARSIKTIDASNNKLSEFNHDAVNSGHIVLILNNNKLSQLSIQPSSTITVTLDISSCSIENFKTLTVNSKVEWDNLIYANNKLDLTKVQLKDILLSTRLNLLDLSNTGISNVPSEYFKSYNIKTLKLPGNKIGTLRADFAKGATIENLDLSNSKISNIEASAFKEIANLRQIHLSDNDLTEVLPNTFADCPDLFYLDLDKNSIKTLKNEAFKNLPQLLLLHLASGTIETLEVNPFVNLNENLAIYLGYNKISNISRDSFSALKGGSLSLIGNNITLRENHTFSEHSNLKTLSITVREDIPSHSFMGLQRLQQLSIVNSEIKTIKDNAFRGLDLLEKIDFGLSQVGSFEDNALNGLFNLKDFDWSVYLTTRNNLTKGLFLDLISIEKVNMSYSSLVQIEAESFVGMYSLKTLLLDNNLLTRIVDNVFANLTNLETLDISNNNITTISLNAFSGLDHLLTLNLENNKLSNLPVGVFEYLASLEGLHLRSNNIATLELGTFSNLRLKYLNLAYNKLTSVDVALFLPLGNLYELNLDHNLINNLNQTNLIEYIPTALKKVKIDHNKWSCHQLAQILSDFNNHGISLNTQQGDDISLEKRNIDGIECDLFEDVPSSSISTNVSVSLLLSFALGLILSRIPC